MITYILIFPCNFVDFFGMVWGNKSNNSNDKNATFGYQP